MTYLQPVPERGSERVACARYRLHCGILSALENCEISCVGEITTDRETHDNQCPRGSKQGAFYAANCLNRVFLTSEVLFSHHTNSQNQSALSIKRQLEQILKDLSA